jgi:hypothetical protein
MSDAIDVQKRVGDVFIPTKIPAIPDAGKIIPAIIARIALCRKRFTFLVEASI